MLISDLVISDKFFFVIGLPFKYKTASILVIKSRYDESSLIRLEFLILLPNTLYKLTHIYSDAPKNNLYVLLFVSSQYLYPKN